MISNTTELLTALDDKNKITQVLAELLGVVVTDDPESPAAGAARNAIRRLGYHVASLVDTIDEMQEIAEAACRGAWERHPLGDERAHWETCCRIIVEGWDGVETHESEIWIAGQAT